MNGLSHGSSYPTLFPRALPSQGPSTPLISPRTRATPRPPRTYDHVWNPFRDIITKLYREEDKTLKEVREIMERDHNFKATERMYKTRIKKWGLDKKLKAAEVLAVLHLKSLRDATQKRSTFVTPRGYDMDITKVDRYVRRRREILVQLKTEDWHRPQENLTVICRTPPPSPPLKIPELWGIHERFLWTMTNYISTLAERDQQERGFSDFEAWKRSSLARRISEVDGLIQNVAKTLSRGEPLDLPKALGPVYEKLQDIIQAQNPVFIFTLCRAVFYMSHNEVPQEVLFQLLDYVSQLSGIILTATHPFTIISSLLCQQNKSDFFEASLVPLLQATMDIFGKITRQPGYIEIAIIYGLLDLAAADASVSQKVNNWVTEQLNRYKTMNLPDETWAHCSVHLSLSLSNCSMKQNNFQDSTRHLDAALALTKKFHAGNWFHRFMGANHFRRACLGLQQRDYNAVIALYLKAIWHERLTVPEENVLIHSLWCGLVDALVSIESRHKAAWLEAIRYKGLSSMSRYPIAVNGEMSIATTTSPQVISGNQHQQNFADSVADAAWSLVNQLVEILEIEPLVIPESEYCSDKCCYREDDSECDEGQIHKTPSGDGS